MTAVVVTCIYIASAFSVSPVYTVNRLARKFSLLRNKTVVGLVVGKNRETVEKISFAFNSVSIPFTAFVLIVACTVTLSLGLQRATEWRNKSVQSENDKISNRNQKVAKMVVMMSVLFIVCFIPANIIVVSFAYEPALSFGGRYLYLTIMLGALGLILESINSSANIFIYYSMSSKFRETFREVFVSCKVM